LNERIAKPEATPPNKRLQPTASAHEIVRILARGLNRHAISIYRGGG
jgi:hypothetical protein